MSVMIRGVEMPTNCDMCWALDDYGDYPRCRITEEQRGYNFRIRENRMDKCPLVPVPPHGRLIDADALDIKLREEQAWHDYERNPDNEYLEGVKDGLHEAASNCQPLPPSSRQMRASDMMYDELIKALHDGAEFLECSTPGIKNSFAKMCHNAADAIEELSVVVRAQKAVLDKFPRWIPVTERLPEQKGKYLAFALEEENTMDFYDGHWMLCGTDYRRYVTHWMPLPEPPKEE